MEQILRSEVQQGLWLVSYGAGGFILRRTSRLTFQLLLQWCAVRLTPGVTSLATLINQLKFIK